MVFRRISKRSPNKAFAAERKKLRPLKSNARPSELNRNEENCVAEKKRRLEIIAIVIAASALLISGSSIYFQFFHKTCQLVVSISDFNYKKGTPEKTYYDYICNARVALINTGTQNVVVTELSMGVVTSHTPKVNGVTS